LKFWTKERLEIAHAVVRRYPKGRFSEAVAEVCATLDADVSADALRRAFRRYDLPAPGKLGHAQPGEGDDDRLAPDELVDAVLSYARRQPIEFLSLCERLDRSPRTVRSAIEQAQHAGFFVRFVDGLVSCRAPFGPGETVEVGGSEPGRQRVAVATDIHFGSKHCDRDLLLRFLDAATTRGCTTVVCTGDILDGDKSVLRFEQDFVGFDRQVQDAQSVLSRAPRMKWLCIEGNHDGYFSALMGTSAGRILQDRMRECGLDWTHLGACLGHAKIHGALWELWHPHGAASSRESVRRVMNTRSDVLAREGTSPDVLAVGHYHKQTSHFSLPERTFCVCGGCFQRKGSRHYQGSEFSNRISNSWHLGGAIVSYTVAEDGSLSEFTAEFLGPDELLTGHK